MTTSRAPPRLSLPPSEAMPETLYCLAGASPVTVTVSPTLKPYFFAVPRSSATSSVALRAARPRRSRGPGRSSRRLRDEQRRRAVGDDRLALLVQQRAVGADAALGDLDARHRLDLRPACRRASSAAAEKSALTACSASIDDVDALLGALEQVRERLVDRVGEDQRADHEGDADDDREARQDRPQLARQQALAERPSSPTPRPSSGRGRPRRRCRRRRGRPRRRAGSRSGRRPRPAARRG